jgi:hypothetical protein
MASSEKAAAMTASQLTAIQKAAKALAQLSDQEWTQVKCVEDRRRADQP